jgi:predicted nucleic acid-binding Zn ribbon protein
MDHISAILRSVLAESRLQGGVANYGVFARWPEVVGEHLASQSEPLRVQGNVLWVQVNDSTLLYHLSFLVPEMLRRIREQEPGSRIESIRFTLNPES